MPATPPSRATTGTLATARGTVQVAVDGVLGVVGIVEALHQRIQGLAPPAGDWREAPTRGITGLVYRSIRGTTGVVGKALETALAGAEALLPPASDARASDTQELVVSALNGVVGDHLEATGNPLAIPLELRVRPRPGAPPAAARHLLVTVHGLCMSEQQWTRQGHNHAEWLAAPLAATPVYVRYNSGRHVGTNGEALAEALDRLVRRSPVPVERITFLGHSMGGLVARAAVLAATAAGRHWPALVRDMVFLGTPHHGAPLERGGHWLHAVFGLSPYLAPFGKLAAVRSEGITDLRHGNVAQPDGDRFARRAARPAAALPPAVRCFAVAGSLGPGLVGDGLVTVDSALGRHADPARDLRLPAAHGWVAEGVGHLDLLASAEVAGKVEAWLAPGKAYS